MITDNCWLWAGTINNYGYGIYWFTENGRRTVTGAHRVIYEALEDIVPIGMFLHHKCAIRRCVNPAHLEIVTSSENNKMVNKLVISPSLRALLRDEKDKNKLVNELLSKHYAN